MTHYTNVEQNKQLMAVVCRLVAGEVAVTSVAASGFVETAIWPLERDMSMKKNKTELDWTPAEEPVVLETEMDTDEDTIGVESEGSEEVSDELLEEDDTPPAVPGEVLDRVQEFFGEPEDMESSELDLENNWFHGLSVRELDTLALDRLLIKNLGELLAWIREYKATSWQMRRKDKDGNFTPLALECIERAKKLDVDLLDWNGDNGAWDMAVQVFGLRLVKLLGALREGKVPLDSKLGQVRVDWNPDRPMQKMGQKRGGENGVEYYHTSPLMEGVLHPNFDQITYFADKAAGRYLGEGVFDGVGGQDLDTTFPALDPTDSLGLWLQKRDSCITVPYRKIPKVDEKGKTVRDPITNKAVWTTVMQSHFLRKETFQDENDKKYKVRRVPTEQLDINFADAEWAELPDERTVMVSKKQPDGTYRIVKDTVKVSDWVPQKKYVPIWSKLDKMRSDMEKAKETMRSAERGEGDFCRALADLQRNAYWYAAMTRSYWTFVSEASRPDCNSSFKEVANGVDKKTNLIIRVNYRVFTLELTKEDEDEAKLAGVYHAWKKAVAVEGQNYVLRWCLFSRMSEKDYGFYFKQVRNPLLEKAKAEDAEYKQMKKNKAKNKRNKGPKITAN